MKMGWAAVAIAAIVTMPVAAQDAQDKPKPVAKPKAEKKICRQANTTGTRLGAARTCHTAAEWADIDANNAGNTNAALRAGGALTR